MPQPCKACRHPDRDELDRAILGGEPNRRIASRVGISEAAIRRHAAHVPRTLALAKRAEEVTRADDLLESVRSAEAHARRLVAKAEKDEDIRAALAGLKVVLDALALLGKVAAEQRAGALAIASSPEWDALFDAILPALAPYPDATAAVQAAVDRLAAGTVETLPLRSGGGAIGPETNRPRGSPAA